MEPETVIDGLAIPPALLAEVEAASGIHEPADDLPMTDDDRQTVREKIAQGLQSLRGGKGTDGASFFAQI